MERIIYGLFKKMVIADSLAPHVNSIFFRPYQHTGIEFLIAAYLFTFQLYFDFSGYSDVAIGIGKILGIHTPENFNIPYLAVSLRDFWKRWHISLSSWFKDYVYIPLGGNRKGTIHSYFNILFVFLITGIWHGANWTFVLWGLMHGLYQIMSIITGRILKNNSREFKINTSIKKYISVFITFQFVVFSWIFFRSNSINDALHIIKGVLHINITEINLIHISIFYPLILMLLIVTLKNKLYDSKIRNPVFGKLMFTVGIIILIFFFAKSESQDFLYFKF